MQKRVVRLFKFVKMFIFVFIIIALTFTASKAEKRVDTTADIYRLFGVIDIPTAEEEENALAEIQDEYGVVASRVAEHDMFEVAKSSYLEQYQEMLKSHDKEIYSLQVILDLAEKAIVSSGNETVEIMMVRDSYYRDALERLDRVINARAGLVDQLSATDVDDNFVESDRERLVQVEVEVERRISNYERALSYKQIGDLKPKRFPVSRSSKITSPFGWRLDPITQNSMQFHRGMDLRASKDTPVLALFNGIVESCSETAGGGMTLVINHGDGIRSMYMHLNEFLKEKGDVVRQYEKVALSGNTGQRTTGPHLHLGLYIGGISVNPEKLYN